MVKRILAAVLALVVVLLVFPADIAATDSMVTVTYPDGTVVQMTLQAYLAMMGGGASSSTTSTAPVETQAPDEVPWPTYNLVKYPLEFENIVRVESSREQSYAGPSRNYAETGAYKPYKTSRLNGLFKEGTYIFVEINYPSVGLRRLYFNRGAMENTSGVPEVTLVGYPAVTTEAVSAWYGPGGQYDPFENASVGANTKLTVFFEENGYVFAEYEASFQLVRAWISANSVKPE